MPRHSGNEKSLEQATCLKAACQGQAQRRRQCRAEAIALARSQRERRGDRDASPPTSKDPSSASVPAGANGEPAGQAEGEGGWDSK